MDAEKHVPLDLPQLPPPVTAPPEPPPPEPEPALSPSKAERLGALYRLWCAVTLTAALLTLALLGANRIAAWRDAGDAAWRQFLFTRILGVGEGDGTLIDLMLDSVFYPRAALPAKSDDLPTVLIPPPAQLPETDEALPAVTEPPPPLDVYAYDPAAVPAGEKPILPLDLSLAEYGANYLSNETAYTPDIPALLQKTDILPAPAAISASAKAGEPLVLILHTHGTEAYSPDGAISYPDAADYARSLDPEESVLAVGERMAEVLREAGIPTLHCVILHDKSAYRDAYVRAAETISAYLAAYPSIEYVLDVHRDALVRGEGELVRPVVALGGEAVAQVMILAGTDYKGAYFPAWQDNLAFALQLRERLNAAHPGIARPVYLRGAAFNEHLGPRSLLLEIGASGNSLPEALRAGERVAATLAEMILGR